MSIAEEALEYIKRHKRELLAQFTNDKICPSEQNPLSFFMAGSPGAGKTEFSRNFLKKTPLTAVRIDADEIRNFIPYYTKTNSTEVQGAAARGVEYLYDYVLHAKKSCILDGTFADYKKSRQNIERSLHKKRYVSIIYVYQDPLVAWKFTKARETIEGRPVPKQIFIDAFYNSYENVKKIKLEFGNDIHLILVKKNFAAREEKLFLDVDAITPYITLIKDVTIHHLS